MLTRKAGNLSNVVCYIVKHSDRKRYVLEQDGLMDLHQRLPNPNQCLAHFLSYCTHYRYTETAVTSTFR